MFLGGSQASDEELNRLKEELKITKKDHADAKLRINALETELLRITDPLKQRFAI